MMWVCGVESSTTPVVCLCMQDTVLSQLSSARRRSSSCSVLAASWATPMCQPSIFSAMTCSRMMSPLSRMRPTNGCLRTSKPASSVRWGHYDADTSQALATCDSVDGVQYNSIHSNAQFSLLFVVWLHAAILVGTNIFVAELWHIPVLCAVSWRAPCLCSPGCSAAVAVPCKLCAATVTQAACAVSEGYMMLLQVERLSKLIETPVYEMGDKIRFEVINSTANVDKRLVKLFELVENDLLAKIVHSTQSIAPYKVSQAASFAAMSLFSECICSRLSAECPTLLHSSTVLSCSHVADVVIMSEDGRSGCCISYDPGKEKQNLHQVSSC